MSHGGMAVFHRVACSVRAVLSQGGMPQHATYMCCSYSVLQN